MHVQRLISTPLGTLRAVASDDPSPALTHLDFCPDSDSTETLAARCTPEAPAALLALLDDVALRLNRYFQGHPLDLTGLPLRPLGTPFQQRVWSQLRAIPLGTTRSYADIARALGDINAVRAVGLANRSNPIAILIPCHRVIGADGALVGYAGGLDRKRALLELEGALLPLGR